MCISMYMYVYSMYIYIYLNIYIRYGSGLFKSGILTYRNIGLEAII